MAPLMKNEKIVICRFERSCGTFKRGGGGNLVLSMTLGQFV